MAFSAFINYAISGRERPYHYKKRIGVFDAGVAGTPGAGFGRAGEEYFRLTAFNTRENTIKAMELVRGSEDINTVKKDAVMSFFVLF